MNSCIILSHVFVRPDEHHKLQQIDFAVKHYRLHNPNSYIILTGHGLLPSNETFDLCDFVHWDRIITEEEIGTGHPRSVNIGLNHATQNNFIWTFKCRADSVILRDSIDEYCFELLNGKRILLTQQTEFDRVHAGDLFMFGQTQFLRKCWDITNWYPTETGLTSFANNLLKACSRQSVDWIQCLLTYASFVDIFNIKWIDLGYNWDELKDKQAELLANELKPFEKYLWGTAEGAHVFDGDGNMVPYVDSIICERTWQDYEDNIPSRKPNGS